MLSKNNRKEQFRKQEPKKQRFAIKKLTVGVASVLIGFTFMGMNASANTTAEANSGAGDQPVEEPSSEATNQNSQTSQVTLTNSASAENSSSATTASAQSSADQQASPISDEYAKKVTENTAAKVASQTSAGSQSAATVTSDNANSTARENYSAQLFAQSLAAVPASQVATTSEAPKTLRGTQTQDVSDWQGFVNAMNDSSVGTINLTSDITVANKGTNINGIHRPNPVVNSGKMNLTGSNISGGLIIDGQNHAINFGANYLSFDTNNQKDSNPWDIDFKNLTINADGYDKSWSTLGGAFSPIYMGGDDITPSLLAKNKVTFENVTADVKNGAFYNTTMARLTGDDPYTTVTFKGNNNITVEAVNVDGNQLYNYSSAVSASHIIFANDTNTIFNVSTAKTNNDQNAGGNILRAKVEDEKNDTAPAIDVQQGATVTLNGKSTDVKGMLVNSAITGTVQVDGNLNANMADGHSMAIWAGNLNIGKTGNVTINTEQSNDGSGSNGVTNYNGAHFAPISLGVGFAANVTNADSNLLDNAGTLTVIRTGNNNTSTTPLISFGSGNGTGAIFTLNVHDGATLDLQDGANSSYAGSIDNTPHSGLVTMWGSGNGTATYSDNVSITNPKYVNLQRTGSQTGTLFRLEDQNNHVNVQSNGAGNPLPFAQWDESNKQATPSHYWYINNLITQNNWGNNSITGFTAQGNAIGQSGKGQDKFLHSNGTVTFGGSQAGLNQYQYKDGTITQGQPNPGVTYQTPYLNNFLNDFSWWTPQRISMGTNLETKVTPTDAEKYQPVVQTIDGNTTQTLSDLTAKDGIKGLLSSDGTVTTDLSSIKNVSWYDAATDATEWKTVMGDEAEPTNPTGDLKTTDKSAWAKVTYTDGSVDFANIPLNITEPMANLYTPSYKPVTVEQGQIATDDPAFTDQDGKDATAPTGTTFTTGTDTPAWATIDPSTGTVTVNPGANVTPGAYNVPVTVTYPDKSTDETTVPVIVTKAGQTVTWGDNGAVVTSVDTSKLNAHETTENSQVLSAAGVVTAEGYELTDGKLSTTATPITIDPSTVSWTTTPDTNVATATVSGKEITTSVNVDFTNNDAAKNILGSKNGVVTTNPFTIDANGAGAKAVSAPVDIKLGSDLTSEQFNQLVDNNIPTDEIAKTEWATKPNEQGQGGVIKITFTDKDANGNPTYLNINIPASSIKVTTDAETNTPQGQDVSTKVGEVPDPADGIKNKGDLPNGTKYTWQDTPDTTKPGKKPAVVVVTYPDGSKDTVSTNVIVNAQPEIKTITTTVGGDPAATEGIANLDNGSTTSVDGYPSSATWTTKPDTSKPGATTGTATVTYPDGTTETVTIPVAVNGGGDVVIINNGHVFSLHANNVVTHKTSDKNIIGEPVIENFKLSYYEGGQNYSKPYIYTLNGTGTEYILTQPGDNPSGVTVNAPQSINASDIKISWTADGAVLFNNALGAIKGNGQPTSLASENNGGTKTITYTNWVNNQFGYPKYSAIVNSSSVNWPIYGKGPVSTYPFPSVYIYGAEANGTIPSVNSDVTDLKTALGDASKLVNTSDLTAAHNAEISSVAWQKLPSLEEANAKAPATVRINFIDGSYLDVPVAVNVIKVDQGINNKTNSEIYRDITRTINVEGESTPVVQHVIYSRAKVTNLSKPAGQQVTYTDWVAAKNSEGQAVTNFPQFNVTKPGYTATAIGATIQTNDGQQYVPASATITPDSQNETVDVTYTANEHMLVINYVDGNGNVVGTYNVPGKTDETVNVDVPENVPTNWKLVPGQQVIGSYKFGSNDPQPVDYKVEHGTAVVPVDKNNKNTYRTIVQTIQEVLVGQSKAKTVRSIIVPFQRTGIKDLVTGDITWNAWQGPEGSVDKDGQSTYMIPVYTITPQKGYDTYVNGEKNTANQIPAVDVTATSKNITDTIAYVREGSTPVPYDPSNKDMNMSVTRIINYEVPTGHATITPVTQTIEYIRDNDGVAGYRDPVTGDITWNPWHVKNGNDQFPSTSITQIAGYDSYVDGTKTTEVPAASVVEKDGTPQNGKTVTVSYQKQGTTQTDADKYTPEGQDVNTKTGVVPDPADGIKNKSDLPEGTKYTWKNTPDVTTAGDKTGTVIVTYPDDSKDEVPVTIRVTNPTTDADKYTADGGNITVDKGHVLTPTDAENAIVNHSDLPEGTTYTWKYAPDTNTVGNKNGVVTVTYPDGSVDEVPVMVHVVDDADKCDPQGQTITIKKGDPVPSAEQGIKNASELPSGTKYTWDVAPDPAKVGSQPVIITVNYPDGSQDQVPTTVIVTDTTTPSETDADKYNPQGQVVNVDRGAKLPDASEGIANKDTLPDGTKYTWKNAPDTSTTGDKPAVITVTYPDGSNEDVPTIVHVNSTDADKYTPQGQNITVDKGAKVPDAATAITNKRELPADTKYTWETTPDTNKVGAQPAVVIVTYPDGSQDNVPVIITVKNPETQPGTTTDVDKYTPEGGTIVTTIGANLTDDAPEGIVNKDALPAGTKYSWTNGTPSTSQAGLTMHYVTVTYPDGSSEVVPVYVNVTSDADKYSPEPQTVTVKKGETPNPADGIKNKGDLPGSTKYTWKTIPDTTTSGDKPAVIVVTYPDGSKDEVPTVVHVTNPATDADKYTPETQPITTPEGKVPDASDGIKNKTDLPNGTKYTWTDPDRVAQDVKKPGSHTETITITYPDGSEDTVTVTVNVPAPEGQNITTDQGQLPNPADAIKNKDQMPAGTTYTWKQEPDVSTPGDHTGVVEVHFPDGTTSEVTVTVHVDAVNHDNSGNINSGNGSIDHQNGTEINNGSVIENATGQTQNSANNSTSQQPAKTLPQTGNDSSKFSALAGLSLAAVASLFGFADHDKKRKADK